MYGPTRTAGNTPGIDMLASTASSTGPRLKTTSRRVLRSTATVANGVSNSSNRPSVPRSVAMFLMNLRIARFESMPRIGIVGRKSARPPSASFSIPSSSRYPAA
jgi:hypothetical protein